MATAHLMDSAYVSHRVSGPQRTWAFRVGRGVLVAFLLVLSLANIGCSGLSGRGREASAGDRLLVFAGAASKPPTEEITKLFEAQTGAVVDVHFGGSGSMLSEMDIAKQGDVYFPGSSDWMEVAVERELVFLETEQRIVYLVNSVNVQADNPKDIQSLEDLLRPDVRVVIANPENVCVGAYAVELLETNYTDEQIRQFREANLVNWAESCEKTANAVSLEAADAVIGWSCFEEWDPSRIKTIALEPDELVRVAYIPIAVSRFAENRQLAERYIEFMQSEQSMEIFRKYGYFTDVEQAQSYAGADEDLPVGGWYEVPDAWLVK